jgi:hypothetical protein
MYTKNWIDWADVRFLFFLIDNERKQSLVYARAKLRYDERRTHIRLKFVGRTFIEESPSRLFFFLLTE